MGFKGIIIAAASLFSSVVSGYMAVYLLTPVVGEWISGLGRQIVVGALASSVNAANPGTMFTLVEPNSWLGLACVVCTVMLLGIFMNTLKALAEPE